MNTLNENKHIFESKKQYMPILMWLIKSNCLEEVRNYLDLNEKYFYPERPSENNSVFDRFFNNSENIKKDTRYTAAAIKQKNAEMLKLLIDYGFAANIFNNSEFCSKSENENHTSEFLAYNNYTFIDSANPFVTDDEKLFEILLHTVPNINRTYNFRWVENDKENIKQQEMSLLGIALYFNKMNLAEILIKHGAKIEFNMYDYMLNSSNSILIWSHVDTAIASGYLHKDELRDDAMELKHKYSPIGIILTKSDMNQIEWLMNHIQNNPMAIREVAMSVHYLDKNIFNIFINKYPMFIKLLSWKNICFYSDENSLRLYLKENKPKLNIDDIIKLLDFDLLTYRSSHEVFDFLLADKIYKCIRILYNYAPDLFLTEDVQNQLYNISLYIWFMEYALNKNNPAHTYIPKLLSFYDKIASFTPDASLFIRWFYARGRISDIYTLNTKEAVNVIKMCNRPNLKGKPRLNLTFAFSVNTDITQTELASLMDTFSLYSKDGNLCNFYKLIIQKDNISLLKKLLALSLNDTEIKAMTEYAIDTGAEKLIPILLLYNMKNQNSPDKLPDKH